MNYHLITQDKFFGAYVADLLALNVVDSNTIWVRGVDRGKNMFPAEAPVVFIGEDRQDYLVLFSQIKSEDKLFVSWYDTFIGEIILELKLKCEVFVYVLGAEFYEQPEWWHKKWLWDDVTRRKIIQERLMRWYFPLKKPWRWYRIFKYLQFKERVKDEYRRKLETVRRIDYLVLPESSTFEVDFLSSLYPGIRAKHRFGVFEQNFELAQAQDLLPIPGERRPIRILLGNSSDPSGNQLDALAFLKKNMKEDAEIYSFLSYGDKDAKEWIIKKGHELFGENFVPVTDFMPREKFVQFVKNTDIILMYHNRQQAMGNILTALTMGKPVFLKSCNPVYMMLKQMEVASVYSFDDFLRTDLRDAIKFAQQRRSQTILQIEASFSCRARRDYLKKLL